MLFTTIEFWGLFTLFLLFFAILRCATRKGMMLYVVLFSLVFYYLSAHLLSVVLPGIGLFTWYFTRQMMNHEGKTRKRLLWLILIIDLLPLLIFKYTTLAVDLWNLILQSNFSLQTIAVPVGVSFFTFQAISYTIDVYRGKFTDQVSLLEFLFYLTFFPLIFAGPITRAGIFFHHFRPASDNRPDKLLPVSMPLLYTGLWLIMLGLVKKLIIADYIAEYNNWIFEDPTAYSGFEVLMGIIGYSVQIYCDFSGYSDLSIGMSALLGVRLPDNFNLPYQSLNITEFWRRWHISLSTWFRDYLYIPLGGNRKGKFRTYLNNFLTMLVAGIWHGSTPMFILWGAMHGLGLIIHKANKPWLDKISDTWFTKPFAWLLTMLFLLITWIFFRAESLDVCSQIFCKIATDFDINYLVPFVTVRPLWTFLVIGSLLIHATRREVHHQFIYWYVITPWIVKVIFFAVIIQLCIEMHVSSVQPFIYYQF